jgi:hypothetical protein
VTKTAFRRDYRWQREYLPAVKCILGLYLFAEASWEEDAHHATDLMALKAEPVRVGARVRRYEEAFKPGYSDQFTIRCSRPNGVKTELAKILEGWGDYFFYGFAGYDRGLLCGWMLGDLNVFRHWWQEEYRAFGIPPGERKSNRDESSDFYVYEIAALPRDFLVARETVA